MGAVICGMLSSLLCCCCSTATGCCSLCCPSCTTSQMSRIVYFIMFIIGMALSLVALFVKPFDWLSKLPSLCNLKNMTSGTLDLNKFCLYNANFSAVYRIHFAIAIFFLILSILMIRVSHSDEIRAKINNGFWIFKIILYFAFIVVAVLFIPDPYFSSSWMIFGMIGSFLFMIIQLIILLDLSYLWNETWVAKYEEQHLAICYYAVIISTVIFYLLTLLGTILLILYFAFASICHLNRFFIIFNVILCVACSICAVIPKVQEFTPRSGLLQSSVISFYLTLLTWSAVTSNQDYECNPTLTSLGKHYNIFDKRNKSDIISYLVSPLPNLYVANYMMDFTGPMIALTILFFFCIFYFSIRNTYPPSSDGYIVPTADTSAARSPKHTSNQVPASITENQVSNANNEAAHTQNPPIITTAPTNNATIPSTNEDGKLPYRVIFDDEKLAVRYDYSLFHFILCLGSTYLQMTFTHWLSLNYELRSVTYNKYAIWVKMSASWLSCILYIWSLVAPVLFPDRDFS